MLFRSSDGAGGLRVSSFALPTTDVFAPQGFADTTNGIYFGYPAAYDAASANSFVTIVVDPLHPLAALSAAQIARLAYGDCAPGGMMGAACMTGVDSGGTMGGHPVEQTTTVHAAGP